MNPSKQKIETIKIKYPNRVPDIVNKSKKWAYLLNKIKLHAHKKHNPFHVEYHDGDIHVAYKKGNTTFMVNIPELSHDSHGGHSDSINPAHGIASIGATFNIPRKKK